VLWLIKALGPGGAERLLVAMASTHDRARFAMECAYVVADRDHLAPELEARGVAVHCVGARRLMPWPLALRTLLNRGGFDIVHVHSPLVAGVARLVVRTLPRRRRPPTMATEHNPWPTLVLATRLLNALTSGLDAATISVSEETRRSIRPRRLQRRAETIVHGVERDRLVAAATHRDEARARLGLLPHEVAVVCVANYRRQKNWPGLLAAARQVVDSDLPVRFFGVGQGPLEAEVLSEHRRLELGDRFVLLGFQPDVAPVLAAGDLLALASHYEGCPVAVMEALSIGLPVVATAVGGVVDAVRDGIEGRLVPAGRSDLLADALSEVVADAALRMRLARGALERGRTFDVQRAARRVESIYEAVAARPLTT